MLDEKQNTENCLQGFFIPSNPMVLEQLKEQLYHPNMDISHAADVFATDIGLASSILKIINSPFYGMSRTVVDIKQASILLGIETLQSVHTKAITRLNFYKGSCISLERFWDNARDIATIIEYVGENTKSQLPKEHLRTVGLFHDCGIPVFAQKFSDYIHILNEMDRVSNVINTEIENLRYQSNHAIIGYYIACSWNIPKNICKIILHHHDTQFLTTEHDEHLRLTFSCLKAAENMNEKAKRFKNINDWAFIKEEVCDTLGFDIRDYHDLEDDICGSM